MRCGASSRARAGLSQNGVGALRARRLRRGWRGGLAGCQASPGTPPRLLAMVLDPLDRQARRRQQRHLVPPRRAPVNSTRSRSVTPDSTGVGRSRRSSTVTTRGPRPSPSARARQAATRAPCTPSELRRAVFPRPSERFRRGVDVLAARGAVTGPVGHRALRDVERRIHVHARRSRPPSFATSIGAADQSRLIGDCRLDLLHRTLNSVPGMRRPPARGTPSTSFDVGTSTAGPDAREVSHRQDHAVAVESRVGEETTCPRSTRRVRIVPRGRAHLHVLEFDARILRRDASGDRFRAVPRPRARATRLRLVIRARSRGFSPRSSSVPPSARAAAQRPVPPATGRRTRRAWVDAHEGRAASTVSPISAASTRISPDAFDFTSASAG